MHEDHIISVEQQIKDVSMGTCHLVLLGAGASRAACPNGDKNGKRIPLMNELPEAINLDRILEPYGIKYTESNFEGFFSRIHEESQYSSLVNDIENAIQNYFENLELPEYPTIYDYLVLSLRDKDVIATFNWDPFLFQALRRNRFFALPHVLFLHGNVSIGFCSDHRVMGPKYAPCPECGQSLKPSKLLYPIANKDYTNDPFINDQRKTLEKVLERTLIFTIFGYSAPTTDVSAVDFMKKAWKSAGNREMEEIEIINTADPDSLKSSWEPFIVREHYKIYDSYYYSISHKWPRRSCEAIWNQFAMVTLTEENYQPRNVSLAGLQQWHLPLHRAENEIAERQHVNNK